MSRTSTSSPSSGASFLGCISPRTATLAIALLGIVLHLNVYSWLGALTSTLPDVPDREMAHLGTAAFVPAPDKFAHSAAKLDQLIGDSTGNNKNVYLPEWVAEAKAYLHAQGLSFQPAQSAPAPSTNAAAANTHDAITPGPHTDIPTTSPPLDDGAEDAERAQWAALRLVIGTVRWYILLSIACCCAGIVGVVRSQLLLSRLFLVHSFLDFLLSTLSLLALGVVCTYPSVRAHVCDEFGSGELQAWFSSATPPPTVGGISTSPPHTAADPADVTVAASGWETLIDGVFASENCEESFRSTLVPLLMVCGLFFTAMRLQCFFLVQRFYTSLLRSKVHMYGYAAPGALESGEVTPMSQLAAERRRKESKLLD